MKFFHFRSSGGSEGRTACRQLSGSCGMTEAHLHGLMVGREFDGRIFPPKTMETGEPRSAITLEEVVGAGGLGPISRLI